jgi:hypothetical protein
MPQEEWLKIQSSVWRSLDSQHVLGPWWTETAWFEAEVHIYKRAHLPNSGHEVTSKAYERSRTRIGYFALQNWEEKDPRGHWEPKPYVVEIQHFLRIQHPHEPNIVLRLAMVDVHQTEHPNSTSNDKFYRDHLSEFCFTIVEGATPKNKNYPCVISGIATPLTMMRDTRKKRKRNGLQRIMHFVPILFGSKKTRVEQY